MTDTSGTGSGANGTGSQQDLVPPAGGSGAKDPPGEEYISKKQFVAALGNVTARADAAERKAADAQAQLDALKGQQQKPPPTRAELLQLVGSGDLTQEQADAIWEKQIVERAKREATTEVGQTLSASERARKVDAELKGYRELVPDAWTEGSDERQRVEAEFRHLTGVLGHPATKETEAAALRAAFGDLTALRAASSAKPGPADTHAETGGGKPPASGGAGKGGDVLKTLTVAQKQHYQKGIDSGRYKDWGAVKAELEYKPKARA